MPSSKNVRWKILVLVLIVLALGGAAALIPLLLRPSSGTGPKRSVRYTYECKGLPSTSLTILANLDDKTGKVLDVSVSLTPAGAGCTPLRFDHTPPLPEPGRLYSSRAEVYGDDPMVAATIQWVKSCVPIERLPQRPSLVEDWAYTVMHEVGVAGEMRSRKIGGSTSEFTELKSQEFIDHRR